MKKLFFLLICSSLLFACSSDDKDNEEHNECITKNIGYVTIENSSDIEISYLTDVTYWTKLKAKTKVVVNFDAKKAHYVTLKINTNDSNSPTYYHDITLQACESITVKFTPQMDTQTQCQKSEKGYITFKNNSSNPYDVYMNDVLYKRVEGNTTLSNLLFSPNNYAIRAKQVSGFVLYPTVKDYTISLKICDNTTISFPN